MAKSEQETTVESARVYRSDKGVVTVHVVAMHQGSRVLAVLEPGDESAAISIAQIAAAITSASKSPDQVRK